MTQYSVEPRTRKYVKGYGFLSFVRNLPNKCKKKFFLNTEADALTSASNKVVHKPARATGEFLGNKTPDNIVKPGENPRNIEEIIIPPEEREEILNKLRQMLQKWSTVKYLSF